MGFGIGVSSPGMGPRGALESFSSGEDSKGKVFDRHIMRRLLGFLSPYRWQMIVAFIAMLIVSGLTLLVPYLLKIAVDQYITAGDTRAGSYFALYRSRIHRFVCFFGIAAVSSFKCGAACTRKHAQRAFPTFADAFDRIPGYPHCGCDRLAGDE